MKSSLTWEFIEAEKGPIPAPNFETINIRLFRSDEDRCLVKGYKQNERARGGEPIPPPGGIGRQQYEHAV